MKRIEIMRAIQHHHDLVVSKGYYVIMTSLVGSQNYGLDHEGSDIDTFSLIMPSLKELAQASEPKAGLVYAEDGHCNFKDIRVALNLLKKTSPNSVEYFASKYKVYNPWFAGVLSKYIGDNNTLWSMMHCNYKHMLDAMAGMAHQLTKRNMSAGKRYGHALRLDNMVNNFFTSQWAKGILDLNPEDNLLALQAKLDTNPDNDVFYNNECTRIAEELMAYADTWQADAEHKQKEKDGLKLIEQFQMELFKKYLMETNK